MKIKYFYTTNMTVFYNDTFEQKLGNMSLEKAMAIILFNLEIHKFSKATCTDTDTGEVLFSIDDYDYDYDEDNDYDDEPAYYDDGDTCGYE